MDFGVRLTLAYDGTDFAGFQRQRETRTVQGVLDAVLERIAQHPVACRGCSRTDAGVHAEGQVVAFTTTRELPPERWILAANRYLPADVAVQAAVSCAPDYDPRFDARDKTYRYLYYLGLSRAPLLRTQVWHLGRHVRSRSRRPQPEGAYATFDLPAMQLAAAAMVGTHDFAAFRAADDTRIRTERTLHSVRLRPDFRDQPGLLALEVCGDGFMKHMVRVLAGTLASVGRGRLHPDQVRALLVPGQARHRFSETAPPEGLTLVNVTLGRNAQPAQ